MEYSSNLVAVIGGTLEQLKQLRDNPDPVLRTVALAMLPEVRNRVHVQGLDSQGQPIGKYSPGYMVVRTGNYKDAATYKRGVNAGQKKSQKSAAKGEAGKSRTTGANRPVYNRTGDTKVVLSLTRQMENDMTVVQTPEGYGIGYNNAENYQKALYCEATYHKPILTRLTEEEEKQAVEVAINFLPEYLKL